MLPASGTKNRLPPSAPVDSYKFITAVSKDRTVPSQKSTDDRNRVKALNNLANPKNRSFLIGLQNKIAAGKDIPKADLNALFTASKVNAKRSLEELIQTDDGRSGYGLFTNSTRCYDKEFKHLRYGTNAYRALKNFVQQALGCRYKRPTTSPVSLDIPEDAEIRTRPGTFTPQDEAHGKLYDAAIERIAKHPEFVMTALEEGVTDATLAGLLEKNGGCTWSELDNVLGGSRKETARLSERLKRKQAALPQARKARAGQDTTHTADAIKILIWDSFERCRANSKNKTATSSSSSGSAHRASRESSGEIVGPNSPLSISHTTPPPSGEIESLAILHSPKASPPSKFLEGLMLPPHLDLASTTKRPRDLDSGKESVKKVKTIEEEIKEMEEWAASIT